jgi:hypothetical protein
VNALKILIGFPFKVGSEYTEFSLEWKSNGKKDG